MATLEKKRGKTDLKQRRIFLHIYILSISGFDPGTHQGVGSADPEGKIGTLFHIVAIINSILLT